MTALQAIASLPKIIAEVKDSLDKLRESQLQREMDKIKNEVNEVIKRIENANTKEERLALSLKLATICAR
jgi:hypothetical protein